MPRANDRTWSPPQAGERRHPFPGGPVRTTPPTVCAGCFEELQAVETVSVHYAPAGYRWHHVDNVEVTDEQLHRPVPAASRDTADVLVRQAVTGRADTPDEPQPTPGQLDLLASDG